MCAGGLWPRLQPDIAKEVGNNARAHAILKPRRAGVYSLRGRHICHFSTKRSDHATAQLRKTEDEA